MRPKSKKVYDIQKVTTDIVTSVYSGRPGCGCGCRGKYSETKGAKTRILNVLKANADKLTQHMGFISENEYIFAFETDQRYRWVYVNFKKLSKIA